MSTSTYDFGSPERAGTFSGSQPPHLQPPHHVPAHSITYADQPHQRDRAGSNVSRLTTMSSPENMRRRSSNRPERSNTVKTYHEPSVHEPDMQPGAEPGIDTAAAQESLPAHLVNLKAECKIQIIDFSDVELSHLTADNFAADTLSLPEVLAQPRPINDLPCRWISVNGLSWDVIRALGNKYSLHRLAIEDLIHTHTRTKVDWYADHAFVVLTLQKLVRLHSHENSDEKCDCSNHDDEFDSVDEKIDHGGSPPPNRSSSKAGLFGMFKRSQKFKRRMDELPRYLDRNGDGKVDESIIAHSGVSDQTPIKPIRTLHRYESAQIPEHTAFMEKHSVLTDEDLVVSVEQVSIFLLADNTIISFFEHSAEDVEAPIVERLQSMETMLRRSCDASLMLQALIDAIVDLAIPVKDAYNKARKELQVDAMTNPDIKTSRALHIFGEEIDMLQNLFKPIVHLVNALRDHQSNEALIPPMPLLAPQMEDNGPPSPKPETPKLPGTKSKRDREGAPVTKRKITDFRKTALKRTDMATSVSLTPLAHTYFGDVLDHCITMIQALEQMDASASNISTLIFNTVGAKTNNFMMILAVVTVFFAPITFISGYFGMNFAEGSGLAHPFGFFWVIAIPVLAVFLVGIFGFMLWDNIHDFLAKRGIRFQRKMRSRQRRLQSIRR